MKVLVTGSKGQLGYDVINELKKRNYDFVGVDIDEMDITDKMSVQSTLNKEKPDVVIHCAAWTAVDLAEDEENKEKVYAINATGTENIAQMCKKLDCKMIYISTDYVFEGTGDRPWKPEDERKPLNYYGKTKSMGEIAVENNLEKYYIVRISWVFGINGKNFVKTMLNLGKTHESLTVVNDQIGSPTYTYDLARLLVDMAEEEKYGIYHATNESFCSWYDFACEIFRLAGKKNEIYKKVIVMPVDSSAYPAKAKRPENSRMDKDKLTRNGFEKLPTWQNALERYIENINKDIK